MAKEENIWEDDDIFEDDSIEKEISEVLAEEEEEKPKREKRPKKERKPMDEDTRGRLGASLVSIILLLFFGFLIITNLNNKSKWEQAKEKMKVDYDAISGDQVIDKYSYAGIEKEIDENVLGLYEFLLYGRHYAMSEDADKERLVFKFNEDGTYFGHSSVEEDDIGTWELTTDRREYILRIKFDEVTDEYRVEMTDSDKIKLIMGDTEYELYEEG